MSEERLLIPLRKNAVRSDYTKWRKPHSKNRYRRHLCPFCLEEKTHIERHMKSCGKFVNSIDAKLAFSREKERRERLGRQRVSLTALEDNYGINWPLVAHSLLTLEIPIFGNKNEHLKSLQDLNTCLIAKGLEMSRDLPMTVSPLNATETQPLETFPSTSVSNQTEKVGMADNRFRKKFPSKKPESTATGPSSKLQGKLSSSETTQIPGTSVNVTLVERKRKNPPVLTIAATPSKQYIVETVTVTPPRSEDHTVKSPVRRCSVVVEDIASPSSSPSKQGNVEITSPLKTPVQLAKFQSLNKTKSVATKKKRQNVNYADRDDDNDVYDDDVRNDVYDDDVRDKTYSSGKDKGSDGEVDNNGGDDYGCVDEPDNDTNVENDNGNCNVESDQDSSDSEDESDRERKDFMKKYLEENHISVPLNISRRVRESNQFIISLKQSLESELKSKASIRNTILSTVKIMYFFAPDHNIDLFHPSHITNVQKVTDFANTLKNSKMGAETRADYFKAFVVFVNKLKKAPEIRTDMTLSSELNFVLEEVQQLKSRNQKDIKREKNLKKAALVHKPDKSVTKYEEFKKNVERMEEKASKLISTASKCKSVKIKQGDVTSINTFFLALSVKQGQRPCVYQNMPLSSYKAARDSAFREHPDLGKIKILCSVDHKTGSNDIAQIVLTERQFELLTKYVKYVRPVAESGHEMYLFLSTSGKQIHNPSNDLKKEQEKMHLTPYLGNDIRHMIETFSSRYFDTKTQQMISKHLCHEKSTADSHYVDSTVNSTITSVMLLQKMTTSHASALKTNSCLESSSSAPLPGTSTDAQSSKQESISGPSTAQSSPGLLDTRSESPVSDVSSASSVSVNAMGTDDSSRRKALLECCFPKIDIDSALPTASAYAQKVSANPQFRLSDDKESKKKFNSLCLRIRDIKRTEAILEEVGRSKFKQPSDKFTTLLMEKGWFNVKILDMCLRGYQKQLEKSGRGVVASSSGSSCAPKEHQLDDKIVNNVEQQRWVLADISSTARRGQGLFASKPITKGTVVCDYHGKLLSYEQGHRKYLSVDSEANAYMMYFEHKGNKYYMDANEKECECHPGKRLKGRLINHSRKSFNLKPSVVQHGDQLIILFIANCDIDQGTELLFDYGAHKDMHSAQHDWLKD